MLQLSILLLSALLLPAQSLRDKERPKDFAELLAPLLDPEKLDTLKGKRAGHPEAQEGVLLV